jgi:hypothetical protein
MKRPGVGSQCGGGPAELGRTWPIKKRRLSPLDSYVKILILNFGNKKGKCFKKIIP